MTLLSTFCGVVVDFVEAATRETRLDAVAGVSLVTSRAATLRATLGAFVETEPDQMPPCNCLPTMGSRQGYVLALVHSLRLYAWRFYCHTQFLCLVTKIPTVLDVDLYSQMSNAC